MVDRDVPLSVGAFPNVVQSALVQIPQTRQFLGETHEGVEIVRHQRRDERYLSQRHDAAAAEAEYVLKKTENRILLSVSGLGP